MQLINPRLRALTKLAFCQQRRSISSTPRYFQDNRPSHTVSPPLPSSVTSTSNSSIKTAAKAEEDHPVLQKYRELMDERKTQQQPQQTGSGHQQPQTPQRFGDLSDQSIFRNPGVRADTSMPQAKDSPLPSTFEDVDVDAVATALDPQPRARQMWERRKAIQIIRRRGRLTKAEHIERSERSMMINSPLWDTSVKKMMLLARQISGKTVEDAILQMHFSKKVKNAKRIKEFLEFARNKAMTGMGMGLGLGNPGLTKYSGFDALTPPESVKEIEEKISDFVPTPAGPITIKDKKGNKIHVVDPAGMYLARVWVVRGPYRGEPHFRSRHRASIIQHPSARLFIILKEQVTRLREAKEREVRESKKKTWIQLPDLPISAQSQHLLW